jgi:hypothetical protein
MMLACCCCCLLLLLEARCCCCSCACFAATRVVVVVRLSAGDRMARREGARRPGLLVQCADAKPKPRAQNAADSCPTCARGARVRAAWRRRGLFVVRPPTFAPPHAQAERVRWTARSRQRTRVRGVQHTHARTPRCHCSTTQSAARKHSLHGGHKQPQRACPLKHAPLCAIGVRGAIGANNCHCSINTAPPSTRR